MNTKKKLGLYIHIPYCVRKCSYCDFVSFGIDEPAMHEAYVNKLIYEISHKRDHPSNDYSVNSIYIGGGTPSAVAPGLITEILDAVYVNFSCEASAEITIEVNPGTINSESLRIYRSSGINRVSMGAQSFDNATLRTLGRIHSAKEAYEAYGKLRKAGFDNVNIDLMFGIPGQTRGSWEKDIETAIRLSPEHISYYSLGIEEGTPLACALERGEVEPPDQIDDRLMYRQACAEFERAGYVQYEISNCAKPGLASVHNLKYWSMDDYLGFGVAAHSYFEGYRFSNTSDLPSYLGSIGTGGMLGHTQKNSRSDDMQEYIWLGLRRITGIDTGDFKAKFGADFWELYGDETKTLIGRGLLEQENEQLRLTKLGLDLANVVFREYV
ncbi:MAG: radical SAM family heme chaperone HemW [Clostridiales Family XIII bacterium]|nr:radical SAM family heme chaperone HemW [Clostridiales Family XIII bacterium]